MQNSSIYLIIPALNEEKSIGLVIKNLPDSYAKMVIVCDNGSSDNTKIAAQNAGALVVSAPQKGYGNACLAGLSELKKHNLKSNDIVLFLDGDFSDNPKEAPNLCEPIKNGEADIVIGSRELGEKQKGSMTPIQVFGNRLTAFLIKILFGKTITDLGPFRAIRYDKLLQLQMADTNFGWTVEMQIKAFKNQLIYKEIPVSYKKRIGKSKVSGTLKGSILAGLKILFLTFKWGIFAKNK